MGEYIPNYIIYTSSRDTEINRYMRFRTIKIVSPERQSR